MSSKAIRWRAALLQPKPAMVLVEALAAAAVIALTASLFLSVLTDSALAIDKSRIKAEEVMIASRTLNEAPALGRGAPTSGVTEGHAWRLDCAPSRKLSGRRLDLILCTAQVSATSTLGKGPQQLVLRTAFAAPKGEFDPASP
jgi:hypothetical protein